MLGRGDSEHNDSFNLLEDTISHVPFCAYIDLLNNGTSLKPPANEAERGMLDMSLIISYIDLDGAKQLSTSFLFSILKKSFPDEEAEMEVLPQPAETDINRHRKKRFRPRHKKRLVLSKHKRRKADYAALQALYRKNRQAAYRNIFAKTEVAPDFSGPTDYTYRLFNILLDTLPEDAQFVLPDEVLKAKLLFLSAADPDIITVSALFKIPVRIFCKLYCLRLHLGWMPSFLLDSRTSFLPKKSLSSSPAELWPISIPSVLCRHKILASHLAGHIDISEYQLGFRPFDGIAKATHLLEAALDCSKSFSPLSVCIMDLEKAFDRISHGAIFRALKTRGASPVIVNYIKYIYKFGQTFLCFKYSTSEPVRPTRGVRQGDPLPPFLINLVLCSIPDRNGVVVDGNSSCLCRRPGLVGLVCSEPPEDG